MSVHAVLIGEFHIETCRPVTLSKTARHEYIPPIHSKQFYSGDELTPLARRREHQGGLHALRILTSVRIRRQLGEPPDDLV
ncbi:hypothetical protein NCC78_02320 [Micromonospora phytophila]|uniref:hypothetical protein n=1 Tax=Micromonospora phytophila TaxID=709888 RepID=UPI00202E9D46|nr:hypothetical protein [Micromonospora phytophila]MCM0673559.1 hypothetical protein [Micromonospora phytophila]